MRGRVGASGIGGALDAPTSIIDWDQAGLVLATIFIVVFFTEIVTSRIRTRII